MPTVDVEAYLGEDYDGGQPFTIDVLLQIEQVSAVVEDERSHRMD